MAAPPASNVPQRPMLDDYRLDPDSTGRFHEDSSWETKKKIALAIGLLLFGSALIIGGVFVFFQHKSGGIPMLVVGSLAFLPGFYHTRIAYMAWKGEKGFDLNDIPDC